VEEEHAMSHIVEVPDELYRKIEQYAVKHQRKPEAVIVSWVADAISRAEVAESGPASGLSPDEPLALLAGIINVPDADAGDHHNRYFGADELNGDE